MSIFIFILTTAHGDHRLNFYWKSSMIIFLSVTLLRLWEVEEIGVYGDTKTSHNVIIVLSLYDSSYVILQVGRKMTKFQTYLNQVEILHSKQK